MNKTLIVLGILVLSALLFLKSKKFRNVVIVGGVGLLLLGFLTKDKEGKPGFPELNISNKLAGQGWIFFGNNQCPWCTKQKKELGDGFEAVFVDVQSAAGKAKLKELKVEVEGVPHWFNKNTKKAFSGFRPGEELAKLLQ
jgi:hypothetical protein